MILDRILGTLSAAGALAGLAIAPSILLGNANQWDLPLLAFFAASLVPLVYVVAYAGRRDSLEYAPLTGELEFRSVLRALPAWVRAITIVLLILGGVLIVASLLPWATKASCVSEATTNTPPEAACVSWNIFLAGLVTTFTGLAFADTAYLLRKRRAS